ncbi:MAG: DUF4173 domain-containing protein [Hymenobacteraceae bacterium]|nr:DUF4173 domain-containing protein [Hymenobacteraceae bacterium]
MTVSFSTAQKLAVAIGGLVFHPLFWNQIQGINLLLWYVGCTGFIFWDSAAARRTAAVRAVIIGGLLAAGCVVLYGSGVAKLAVWTSLALLVGFANQPALRLLHHALLTGLGNTVRAPLAWVSSLRGGRVGGSRAVQQMGYYSRLLGLPLGAAVVFHLLFATANPQYAALASAFGAWLERLFVDFSFLRLAFLLFGAAISAGLLLRVPERRWLIHEAGALEFISRTPRPKRVPPTPTRRPAGSPVALRKEYLAALIALVLVNALLLIENVLDVQNIWFDFRPAPDFDLAQFVHEGTWALIVSILLAMALVLRFFRGNLNFYASAIHRLRPLATVWVVQNAVLAASVGLRNYHYITRMGLAYKRIGVCFFLMLVVFGLGTVVLKIWQRRSAFSLVRLNSWATYAVLLLLTAGNWEIWIARYNLQPRFRPTLDEAFLLGMPPRVLPELTAHADFFAGAEADYLTTKRTHFLARYPQRGWPSWNLADFRAYHELKKSGW